MGTDISKMNYTLAGVSIRKQNEVNRAIKEKLNELGLAAEGLFGGAIDISHLKGNEHIPIGIISSSIVEDKDVVRAGRETAYAAFKRVKQGIIPIAILDYFASAGMDVNEIPGFVEGVATAGLEINVPTIGGESAQMPGTYNEGKRDAYVHVIFHGNQGAVVDIANMIKGMERPLLCASTDGTGTKTRIVKDPRDIIYHSSNDLGAIGAQPVAFAVYIAGNVPKKELEEIVTKSERICDTLGITSLDATVELKPEKYAQGQVDIAGTVIGVIDEQDMITGVDVKEGYVPIGLAADCLMTNGYSLAREYLEMIGEPKVGGLTQEAITRELSKPHVSYTDILFGNESAGGIISMFKEIVKATAHITGGGQKDNIERMVPDGLCAVVQKEVLPLLPIVKYFKANGADMNAMCETLNMGIGFTITVPKEAAEGVINYVNANFRYSVEGVDRQAARIGTIERRGYGKPRFEFAEGGV